MTKTVQFAKSGEIDPAKVKSAVYIRIDFDLPEWIWDKIDNAFGECWNKEIGLRGWVHEGQKKNLFTQSYRMKTSFLTMLKLNEL